MRYRIAVGPLTHRLPEYSLSRFCFVLHGDADCNGRHCESINENKKLRLRVLTTNQGGGGSNPSGRIIYQGLKNFVWFLMPHKPLCYHKTASSHPLSKRLCPLWRASIYSISGRRVSVRKQSVGMLERIRTRGAFSAQVMLGEAL